MVAPRFEQLSKKHTNCNFLKVDVDDNQDIASQYSVRAMPTFILFKNGKKLDEVVGADINKVAQLVETHAGSGGASGFPAGGGRVLGSGASAAPAALGDGLAIPGIGTLSPMQQQYAMMGGIVLLLVYLYFNQQK